MLDLYADKNKLILYGFSNIDIIEIYLKDQFVCTLSLKSYIEKNPDSYDEKKDSIKIIIPTQLKNFLIGHSVIKITNEQKNLTEENNSKKTEENNSKKISAKKTSSKNKLTENTPSKNIPPTLIKKEISFDEQEIETKFVDKFGAKLSWSNKHHLITTTLNSKKFLQEKILKSGKEISDKLTARGYKIAICSNALLSSVRNNEKLSSNDDDIDFLCFFNKDDKAKIQDELNKKLTKKIRENARKKYELKAEKNKEFKLYESETNDLNAFELNLLQIRLQKTLEEMGYLVFKHSGAHLQIAFLDENNVIEYYIDIFTAFEKDGYWCQPIFMRTKLDDNFKVSDIYPFGKVKVDNYEFSAPKKPKVWLRGCYGDTWMIPDPNFTMPNNFSTFLRFDSWFGYSNIGNLPFWKIYNTTEHKKIAELDFNATLMNINNVKKVIKKDDIILDFGCGDGLFTHLLENIENINDLESLKKHINKNAHSNDKNNSDSTNLHPVYAFDFVERALYETKKQLKNKGSKTIRLNFINRYEMLKQAMKLKKENKHFIANVSFGFHIYNAFARKRILELCNRVLKIGDYIVISYDTEFDETFFSQTNPQTWNYDENMIKNEVLKFGFSIQKKETSIRLSEVKEVRPFECAILKKEKNLLDIKKKENLFI